MRDKHPPPDSKIYEPEATDDDDVSYQQKWENCVSEIENWDTSSYRMYRRHEDIGALLTDLGGFPEEVERRFLSGRHNEEVSLWLREQLSRLREAEKVTSTAPVLSGSSMGRAMISDIAFTMLEIQVLDNHGEPGPNLLILLAELLNVDRHRLAKANVTKNTESKDAAAHSDARCPNIGVRSLAKKLGVAPSTISKWRRDVDYQTRVKSIDRAINSDAGRKFRKHIDEYKRRSRERPNE
jgi:hypothetical protein